MKQNLRRCLLCTFSLLSVLIFSTAVSAQIRAVRSPDAVLYDEDFTLQLVLNGSKPFAGVAVQLPDTWLVQKAILADKELLTPLKDSRFRLQPEVGFSSRTFAAEKNTQAEGVLILTIKAEPDANVATKSKRVDVKLAAVAYQGGLLKATDPEDAANFKDVFGYAYTARLSVKTKPETGNISLKLQAENKPQVAIITPEVIGLDLKKNFTVEFYFRTTATSGVLASKWSGIDADSYPLELEIGNTGELSFYAGSNFLFQKLSAHRNAADGLWHHVAVTNGQSGTKLYLDGQLADSTNMAAVISTKNMLPIYLGSRGGTGHFLDCELDEVRIWSDEKQQADLVTAALSPLTGTETGLLFYDGFERASPLRQSIAGKGLKIQQAEKILSSLQLASKIQALQASLSGRDVQISWRYSPADNMQGFSIERSADGLAFQSIGFVSFDKSLTTYTYTDGSLQDDARLAFYRVKKISMDSKPDYSEVIKLGVAANKQFRLEQNSPNPFNPTTTISYQLFAESNVRVSVFNMIGVEVARIVDTRQAAGRYSFTFDASQNNLATGIYLYRIETDTGIETRKMILLK
jgi:hypothetical protein